MSTDYQDQELFEAAQTLYQGEVSLSQHYETLRSALTAGNLTLVGALLASSGSGNEDSVWFFLLLALVASTLAMRLSHAHHFHFCVASKMRSIVARRHSKTWQKLSDVRAEWGEGTKHWKWLRHAPLWVGLNGLIPLVGIYVELSM